MGNDLGELGEVSASVLEPLDVPRAEEQIGGLAGLNLDGLGVGRSGPEEEGDDGEKGGSGAQAHFFAS